MNSKVGGEEKAHNQRVAAEPVWGCCSKLVLQKLEYAPASHFVGDERIRRNGIAVLASVARACTGIELSVDHPDFPVRQVLPASIGRHRRLPHGSPGDRTARGRWDGSRRE